jgi:ABC-type sugar transport system permease subunit
MKSGLRKQQIIWGYIFISPWILGFAVWVAWPLGRSLLLSFQKLTDIQQLQTEWAGWANYLEALVADISFLPSLLVTLRDLALNLPLILVFSLTLALLLSRVGRALGTLRAIFFLPVIIGSAGVVGQLYNVGYGQALMAGGVGGGSALDSAAGSVMGIMTPVEALVQRLSMLIWHSGVQILLFVAGLHSVPASLYDAAAVDGASGWESFWKITLPMLSPVILVAAIYTVVDTVTDPLNSTVSYIMNVSLMSRMRLDYGSALGWLYFILVFLVLTLIWVLSSRMVFYAGGRE